MEIAAPLVAALWGFAEATLFFIVPDVFLTVVTLKDRRAGFRCCAAAIVGALAGGLLMYLWGSTDPVSAGAAIGGVPGISPRMTAQVRGSLLSTGLLSLFLGPLTGTPYKIYAVTSGTLGLSLPLFLLISIPARGMRFLIVTLAVSWASDHLLASWSLGRKRAVAVALWIVFYAMYFAMKR